MNTGHAGNLVFWSRALKEKLNSRQLEAGRPRVLRVLGGAKISKRLTSKVQRTIYAKVSEGTVADIYLDLLS